MILPKFSIELRLKELGVGTDKHLGQHFLIDESVLDVIVDAATSLAPPLILEVGPGLGVLTEELVKIAPTITVERDPVFAKALPDYVKDGQLSVIRGNILEVMDTNKDFPFKFQSGLYSPMLQPGTYTSEGDAHVLPATPWAVIANIPYGITSPLIRKLIELDTPPTDLVLLVQKEVAERICAPAGDSRRGLLTLMVETAGNASVVQNVPKMAFWPAPEVQSAVLHIRLAPKMEKADREAILKLAQHAFAGKRKQLPNALAAGLHMKPTEVRALLEALHINPTHRAEALTIDEWLRLTREIKI